MEGINLDQFAKKYPALKAFEIPEVNRRVFDIYSLFVDDDEFLLLCLLQNFFGTYKFNQNIVDEFGQDLDLKLKKLSELFEMKIDVNSNFQNMQNFIVLFFTNYKILFSAPDLRPKYKKFLNQEHVKYAMSFLRHCMIGEIKNDLEDKFFYILDPDTFAKICSAIFFAHATHAKCEKTVNNELENLMQELGLNVEINCRLKSVYGVYNKVKEKNILLPQVLDIVGIRIITEKDEDCYIVMRSILDMWYSIKAKVKDYVALPKENGYRSIHLTILIDGNPVEIQIRSRAMHEFAQFGPASHVAYKCN